MFFVHEGLDNERNTFVKAFDGFECSDIKTEEFSVLKMKHIIGMNKGAIESCFTVSLLWTRVDFIGQWVIDVLILVVKMCAVLQ